LGFSQGLTGDVGLSNGESVSAILVWRRFLGEAEAGEKSEGRIPISEVNRAAMATLLKSAF
jgi:hypothetical protein